MATSTANFGWSVPTSTDLVKDGATAIETLGDAIDASLLDLKGGTTGQLLSKNSGTDMDFIWSTPTSGKVLQVVSATTSTQTTSTSSAYADTTLTGTITPTLATSKILVMVSQNGCTKFSSDTSLRLKLFRAATEIAFFSHSAGETGTSGAIGIGGISINYLDSPATTSATTYKTQFMSVSNASGVRVQDGSSLSTIILLEIGV